VTFEEISRSKVYEVKKRIHIVPLGFEFERVVKSLEILEAEKIIFLDQIESDKSQPYLTEIVNYWIKKSSPLKECYSIEKCDLFSWWDTLRTISEIYFKLSPESMKIAINLSTGTKISAMAGYYASLICPKIEIYYSKMSNYQEDKIEGAPLSSGFDMNIEVPKIMIKIPEKHIIHFLKLFSDQIQSLDRDYLYKRDCVSFLKILDPERFAEHLREVSESSRTVSTRSYRLLKKKYISPLIGWKFLIIWVDGRERIKLTQEGLRNLRIYTNFYKIR
jgi:uncharacterized protein DUF6293